MKSKIINITKGKNKKEKQETPNIGKMDTKDILKLILDGQNELKTDVSELKTDVASLKEGQARLETKQTRLETRQARLEERQTNLEKKVDSIDNSVKVIEGEFKPNFKALTEAFTMHLEHHERKEKEWKQSMDEIHEMYVTMNKHIAKENNKTSVGADVFGCPK